MKTVSAWLIERIGMRDNNIQSRSSSLPASKASRQTRKADTTLGSSFPEPPTSNPARC